MKPCLLVLLVFAAVSAKAEIGETDDHQRVSDDENYDECQAPKSIKGFTLLCTAVVKGQLESVKALTQLGEEWNVTCGGLRPWHLAAAFGWNNIFYDSLKHANIWKYGLFDFSHENCSPLHFAARNGHLDVVNTILDYTSLVVPARTFKGHTALDLVRYVLEFNINATSYK